MAMTLCYVALSTHCTCSNVRLDGAGRSRSGVPSSIFQGRAIRFVGAPPADPGPRPELYAATTDSLDDNFTQPRVLQETLLTLDFYEGGQSARETVYTALIGAGIHGAERNVEMILSLQRLNFSDGSGWFTTDHNHPLSMTCEGNFSPARVHIIEALLAHNYPVGRGCVCSHSVLLLLCKPSHSNNIGYGRSTVVGGPVHEEDKRVVQRLLELGEGIAANEAFSSMFEEISQNPEVDVTIKCLGRDRDTWNWEQQGFLGCRGVYLHTISVLTWPTAPWLSKVLSLDLSRNILTTLPEVFFSSLPSVEYLDLSQNCLWELSPSVGLLKSLISLKLSGNILESLPSDLATLPRMESLDCSGNPVIEPPKAVVRGGWAAVKSCKVTPLA